MLFWNVHEPMWYYPLYKDVSVFFNTVLFEGSRVTGIVSWFWAFLLMCIHFIRFSESFALNFLTNKQRKQAWITFCTRFWSSILWPSLWSLSSFLTIMTQTPFECSHFIRTQVNEPSIDGQALSGSPLGHPVENYYWHLLTSMVVNRWNWIDAYRHQ